MQRRRPDRNRTVAPRARPRLAGVLALLCSFAAADDLSRMSLQEAIASLEEQGLTVFYSSDLIKPWMIVREPPQAQEPAAILSEVLEPYGLAIEAGPGGSLLIVRATPVDSPPQRRDERPTETAPPVSKPPAPTLQEIVVNASRYRLRRDGVSTVRSLAAADLSRMPDLGDDTLRAVARLPGAASGDFSARTNIRGGSSDEMLVRFDDLRLYDPFHLKDFQSVFSSIDPSVVSDVDVYTGGFPVVYGDRMSGVIDIEPLLPEDQWYRELSFSLFNAGAVLAGRTEDGDADWVVSARRGNLDLVLDIIDSSYGDPSYRDFYGRYSRRLGESLSVTFNALVFDDDIDLFDGDREERAQADYRDDYYWLRLDYAPSAALNGSMLLGRSEIESERRGSSEQDGISTGMLRDHRKLTIDSLQTDWAVSLTPAVMLEFGGELRRARGRYRFSEEVEFDLLFDVPGAWDTVERERELGVRPAGDHYGLYGNLRAELSDTWVLQTGLRWDKDTLSSDQEDHVSPRLALMYRPDGRITLRASWGRFYQSQSIHELQIADGITDYSPAQRSDHWVLGLDYRLRRNTQLRLEAYRKTYSSLRPRFENLVNSFVLLPELKPDRIRIAPDEALARGAELSLSNIGYGGLDWWLSYSWARVEDTFADGTVRRSWDQTHTLDAGIAWRGERWEFSAVGKMHTGWPTTAIGLAETEPVPIAAAGPRNGERFGDYRSLDVRAARHFRFSDTNKLTVFLEVQNLLGRSNPCCLEYEFEDEDEQPYIDKEVLDNLPTFPSLGFVWRF